MRTFNQNYYHCEEDFMIAFRFVLCVSDKRDEVYLNNFYSFLYRMHNS